MSSVKYRDGMGECRKNAPRGPVALAWMDGDDIRNQVIMSPFPIVPRDDWCGEFFPLDPTGEALP